MPPIGRTVHRYPRPVFLAAVLLQDLVLLTVAVGSLVVHPFGGFGGVLASAAVAVLSWEAITLHFPSEIVMGSDTIAFRRYGLSHEFRWRDVRALRVRRFLVRDRVLVRLLPAPPWRGRYWIVDGIDGYEPLLRALERRATECTAGSMTAAGEDGDPKRNVV